MHQDEGKSSRPYNKGFCCEEEGGLPLYGYLRRAGAVSAAH